jgi:hypothetical protein
MHSLVYFSIFWTPFSEAYMYENCKGRGPVPTENGPVPPTAQNITYLYLGYMKVCIVMRIADSHGFLILIVVCLHSIVAPYLWALIKSPQIWIPIYQRGGQLLHYWHMYGSWFILSWGTNVCFRLSRHGILLCPEVMNYRICYFYINV